MINKNIFLILVFMGCFSLCSHAQNNFQKYELGISTSADYNYRLLTNNDDASINNSIISSRNDYEHFSLRYSAGIDFTWNLSRKFGFYTGISYSNKGYKTDYDFVISYQSGNIETIHLNGQDYFHYLEIPFQFYYSLSSGDKISLRLRSGINNNILLKANSRSTVTYEDGTATSSKLEDTDFYKKYMIQAVIGFDIGWKVINDNWNLRIGPQINYGITSIVDTPIHGYLFSGGIKFSMAKSLGK